MSSTNKMINRRPSLSINKYQSQLAERKEQSLSSKQSKKVILQSKIQSAKFPKINSLGKSSKSINGYYLREVIGQGAFAKVYRAERESDGLNCVIKVYQKYRLNSQSKRNVIKKQIQILKNIDHPNIIKIIDFYQTKQTINIVMENFSNQSLAIYAKEKRPLPEQTIKKITKSISVALIYLHQNKISHRDLKPQNVLINSQEQIKIIDLGLAMMGDFEQMTVAGTPQFMCPQLIKKKNYCPYKADVWAFGITLYWITMGYYPQDNEKTSKKNIKLANFELKFPIDVHPGIQYLIQKMLEKDPSKRITVEQILEDTWIKPKNLKFQISKLQTRRVSL